MSRAHDPLASPRAAQSAHVLAAALMEFENAKHSYQSGNLRLAKKQSEVLLKKYPDYVGALELVGSVLIALNQPRKAFEAYATALSFCPDSPPALLSYGKICLQLGRTEAARDALETLLKLTPGNDEAKRALASVHFECRDYALAKSLLTEILAQIERDDDATEALLRECDRRMDIKPTGTSIATVSEKNCVLGDSGSDYERAKVFHQAGECARAWECFIAANRVEGRAMIAEWQSEAEQRQSLLAEVRNAPTQPSRPINSDAFPVSIIIGGLPCSGKGALEGLIGAAPGIKRGFDSHILNKTLLRTLQTSRCIPRPALSDLPVELNSDFLRFYNAALDRHAPGANGFTIRNQGIVANAHRLSFLIPSSRFVFMKRDVNDLTLRLFMEDFTGQGDMAFTFDVKTIRNQINWYYSLIDILVEKFPKSCRVVQYEDMIDNPSSIVQQVRTLCGLGLADVEPPQLDDERGVANPYIRFIQTALS